MSVLEIDRIGARRLYSQVCQPYTYDEYIQYFGQKAFDAAIDFANEVEDYQYLSVAIEKRELVNKEITIWMYPDGRVFITYNNSGLNSTEVANWYWIFFELFPIEHLHDILLEIFESQLVSEIDANTFIMEVRQKYVLLTTQFGPGLGHTPLNSPCPCGSEKKYKRCHGLKL